MYTYLAYIYQTASIGKTNIVWNSWMPTNKELYSPHSKEKTKLAPTVHKNRSSCYIFQRFDPKIGMEKTNYSVLGSHLLAWCLRNCGLGFNLGWNMCCRSFKYEMLSYVIYRRQRKTSSITWPPSPETFYKDRGQFILDFIVSTTMI